MLIISWYLRSAPSRGISYNHDWLCITLRERLVYGEATHTLHRMPDDKASQELTGKRALLTAARVHYKVKDVSRPKRLRPGIVSTFGDSTQKHSAQDHNDQVHVGHTVPKQLWREKEWHYGSDSADMHTGYPKRNKKSNCTAGRLIVALKTNVTVRARYCGGSTFSMLDGVLLSQNQSYVAKNVS